MINRYIRKVILNGASVNFTKLLLSALYNSSVVLYITITVDYVFGIFELIFKKLRRYM